MGKVRVSARRKTMRPLIPAGDRFVVILALSLFLGIALLSAPSLVAAQAQYIVQPVAEMKVKELPKGELFWRVESFPTLDEAKAAAPSYRWNPDTVSYDGLPSLTAEVAGKAWLFTLGPRGGATAGGTKVAEIGPVPPSQRARVPAARELRPWAARRKDTGSHASRLRSILCNCWQVGPTDPAGSDEYRGWAFNERTFARNDNGSFQRWDDRISSTHNVRRRRDQAVLGASQLRLKQFVSIAIAGESPRVLKCPLLAQLGPSAMSAIPSLL
jgi:hypothetical protein